ncbi:hypothetical protein [Kribbella sp. NPDC055071]
MQRFALAVAGIGMLAATATAGPAIAGNDPKPFSLDKFPAQLKAGQPQKASAAADACIQTVGWVTPTGTAPWVDVTPANPPKPPISSGYAPYQFVTARASASWYLVYNAAGTQLHMSGLHLQGGNLYRQTTYLYADDTVKATVAKVGSGWTNFKAIATSNYVLTKPRHSYLYGLNTDGFVYRYAASGTGFKALGKFGGFRSFKTLTVIAENPSYDTLLMTTKAGALYTIRIPITATAKPVVKLIRSGGWQNFESLVVFGCGDKGGALITAIDHDTDTANLYAMSKANGKATALTGYGKIPASSNFNGVFDGTADASVTGYYNQLVSE